MLMLDPGFRIPDTGYRIKVFCLFYKWKERSDTSIQFLVSSISAIKLKTYIQS